MEHPRISVIVPVYNVEQYLEKCVKSICGQTYRELEIILVDDGSPDGSGALCDTLAAQDERIRVIHQKNGGLSAARNAGLDAATGAYVAFIDSDDYIAPDMMERLYTALAEADAQMALCNFRKVDDDGADVWDVPPMQTGVYTVKELCGVMETAREYWWYVTACNKLYERRIFETLRFPEGRVHEDEFTVLPVFDMCHTIAVIDERLYYYVERRGSIMRTGFTVRSLDGVDAYMEQYRFYLAKGWRELSGGPLRRAYIKCWQCMRDIDVRAEKKALLPRLREVSRRLAQRCSPRALTIWVMYFAQYLRGNRGRR